MVYNLMTCEGFDTGFFAGCSLAWLGLAVLFFILAFSRKGIEDMLGTEFNFMWSVVVGVALYVLLITFTGAFKWALLAGIVGGLAGGFLLAPVFGGGEGE